MSIDFSGLPISGSLAVGFVFVAAFSYVVAGPVVADRTIKMDGWEARCASKLTREIKREHQSSLPIDAFDCRAIAGSFDPSGAKICGFLDMLAAPAKAAQARAQSLAMRTYQRRIGRRHLYLFLPP
ncbi:hypothetical protein [uncultured Cohaesibacter sp.]|uniref:hypothetical protein n=1 Tax=uncultured Cohaesibacter sp. TaxID=1002546 RepID=UPI0029313C40|nr:hypothetical protein [uncultured Cohaesibacter sp.]